MKRRGRKRKSGARRSASGRLIHRAPSVAEVAAGMPHRRALGERAVDQAAESELGRMMLVGDIAEHEYQAGAEYARLWRAWMAIAGGPRRPAAGTVGHNFDCGGCLGLVGTSFCVCSERQRKYFAARAQLSISGDALVKHVAIHDRPCPPAALAMLALALARLAAHFGLTKKAKRTSNNRSSHSMPSLPPAER